MSTLPTDKAEDTAIDAEVARQLIDDEVMFGVSFRKTNADGSWRRIAPESVYIAVNPGHIIKSVAEGQHYYNFFASLAKEHGPANAALDTARREWAKRGEG